MSEEYARQFVYAVEQDAALQEKIDALDPATAAGEIIKLGAERDLQFSVEEFNTALASHLKSSDQEISEEELSSVTGGANYVQANPNTNASGVPSSNFWVKHGTYNPGEIIDISPKPPLPTNGTFFLK